VPEEEFSAIKAAGDTDQPLVEISLASAGTVFTTTSTASTTPRATFQRSRKRRPIGGRGQERNETMNSLIHILTKSGLLTEDLDYHVVRASMVIIFLFFGTPPVRPRGKKDRVGEAVASDLAAVGIRTQLRILERATCTRAWRERR
jgi:hypothetical protein